MVRYDTRSAILHRQMPHRSQALRRKQNAGKMKTRKYRITPHESVRIILLSVNECVYSCGLGLGGMVCVCLPHVFVMSINAFCPSNDGLRLIASAGH